MKNLLMRSIGLVGLMSGAAMAADVAVPVYKAPPPVVYDPWNGFYGGLNAGIGIGRNPTNDTTALPGLAAPQFGTGIFNHAPQGGIFGLQAGWNWHAAPAWVLGVEADWQWSHRSDTVCTYACLPASTPPALLSITDQETMKWFGTARGRIGWLSPGGSLWYATGGLAWGRVEQNLVVTGDSFFAAAPTTVGSVTQNFSQDKVGWTIGAGIETPIAPHWTAKAEYLYVDLGKFYTAFSSPLSALAAGPGAFGPATTAVTTSSGYLHDHIIRLGVNYHFDAPGGMPMAYASVYDKAPRGPSWSGFYGGLNAGGAIAHNHTTNPFIFSPPTVPFPVGGIDSYTHAPLGGAFGAQLGWNWRVAPSWVTGVEVDWQWTHQTDSACVSQCLVVPAGVVPIPSLPLGVTDSQAIKWLGTARARFGWVAPNGSLWYATGGAAWGRVEDTVTLIAVPPFFAAGAPMGATLVQNKFGWTIGAGTEIPVWDRWSVKAEYLYVDLGRINNSFTSALDPNQVFQPGATSQTTSSVFSVHDHIFRFGVNYHFN
jgi:outer membrane immunogenic protein